MNTHSKKHTAWEIIEQPPADRLDDAHYLYLLPQRLQHTNSIAIVHKNVMDYELGHYVPDLVENQKNQQRIRYQERL